MKGLILGWMLATGTAGAATPADYAVGWPLSTDDSSALWQVELTPQMLAASRDRDLADIEIFNAAGEAVPTAWLPVDMAAIALSDSVTLPHFFVPATAADPSESVKLRLQRDSDGRLHQIETALEPRATTPNVDVIVDASAAVTEGARLQRLHLDWPSSAADRRLRVAVDASDDLEQWQSRVSAATVLQLRRDGAELSRHGIDFTTPVEARYLRLRVLDGNVPDALEVRADRIAKALKSQPQRLSIDVEGTTEAPRDGVSAHVYRLPAALAVRVLDIGLDEDNSVARLGIASRPGADGGWRERARIDAFRLRDGAGAIVNDPLILSSEERAGEWRIEARPALPSAPSVRFGYRPDRLLFLARGSGPFQLAVGSAKARRGDAPVALALDEWRSRHGATWQPPTAATGERHDLAGDAAYVAEAAGLPWKSWLLWSVLLLGAAVVGLFALSLLRERRPRGS